MAVTKHALAEGRLIEYHPHLPGTDDHLAGMVGVVSPITGNRHTLAAVPVGESGQLIAVLNDATDTWAGGLPLAACATDRTAVALAAGRIGANTPVLGRRGPSDLVGCASGDGTGACGLHPAAEAVLDRFVRLEVHGPGCACAAAAAVAAVAAGPGLRAGVGDA
jgi:hypothetical protein